MAEATENKTATAVPTEATTPISKFNTSYLLPHGILKIIEILLCIVILSLTITLANYITNTAPTCGMAVAAPFFVSTLIFLILNLSAKLDKIWFAIDLTVNVMAVISFIAASSVLFVDGAAVWRNYSYRRNEAMRIFAAGGLSAIAPLLYILSIVFAVKAQLTANKVTAQA